MPAGCRYTKPRGQQPDYSSPVVLRRGRCTVEDFCNAIHKEIVKQFKNGETTLLPVCGDDERSR
jgi:ribosome-interacting GTPase 1